MKENSNLPSGGEEVVGILFIATFLILLIIRLMWYVNISWIVVFAPLYVPIILILLVSIFMEIFYKPKNKKEND